MGHFNLLVDVNHLCLVDTLTQLQVHGILTQEPSPSPSVPLPDPSDDFTALSEFPCLLCPPPPDQPVKHTVTHHIPTNGPPVASRPRRLLPERLKIARQEFNRMLVLGIIRPSSSCWASPLHMVPKKTPGREPHHRSRPVPRPPPAGLYLFIARGYHFHQHRPGKSTSHSCGALGHPQDSCSHAFWIV